MVQLCDPGAKYDDCPEPFICPAGLIWSFIERIREMMDSNRFKALSIFPKCRLRLEEFSDTLLYHLIPRFRPFHRYVKDEGQKTYKEVYAISYKTPALARGEKIRNTIYLDDMMERLKVYVLS
jgi:hypothetical protein